MHVYLDYAACTSASVNFRRIIGHVKYSLLGGDPGTQSADNVRAGFLRA